MLQPQSAILPEAGPFAQFTLIKINSHFDVVLEQLKSLTSLVDEVNQSQPEANVKLAIAFTKQCWQRFDTPLPDQLIEFPELGSGKVHAPSTDVDVLIHCHSPRHDLHFYLLNSLMSNVADYVEVVDETHSYRYLDSRDMTGFVDGTENPKGDDRREEVAIIPEGELKGGSYVMLQRFVHNLEPWNKLAMRQQEKIIGRTKPDSIELEDVHAASHVGRVDLKENGKGLKIVRHSLPYGSVSGEHGLLFIAYCNTLDNFTAMLESMYGKTDGKTDMLLNYTKAVTGAYFFAPSMALLDALQLK
ncbi:Dyp-type peroxidase [Vibrio sp. S4M6]|uniref:Dyp-type peroxidase n=1 Tax=Vibrio sinus TaxID=2946865 RepID=UPI00202A185F|nr:Dyp-type peroxidase [Vibrio sinus]MCL9782543.1 Dyp-type peroxidase [Vibrio sinus]